MRTTNLLIPALLATAVLNWPTLGATPSSGPRASAEPKPIPWTDVGTAAGNQYSGTGLAVTRTEHGARLHCLFQHLDGEATCEGLWLTSAAAGQPNDRLRVTASMIGREGVASRALPAFGQISVDGRTVRFTRRGLVEEYSVSMDGVRQDFVVLERPDGAHTPAGRGDSGRAASPDGELRVEVAVSGARVEQAAYGAKLVLEQSGRIVACSRLRVTDANGNELPARVEVAALPVPLNAEPAGNVHPEKVFSEGGTRAEGKTRVSRLVVFVDDREAVYPVRVDPTFSDANWISMGGIPGVGGGYGGANTHVYSAVADGSGNLYVAGDFTVAGGVFANSVAKWNGTNWSNLGSGMNANSVVYALAVSGSNLYAGGTFATAGGVAATNVAKWNGTNWVALGSGVGGVPAYPAYPGPVVLALTVVGSDLYVGGVFTNAGNLATTNIAKWNGNAWSSVGQGVSDRVNALATSGGEVYAGGYFTQAGGNPANYVAKWTGSTWSTLGMGVGSIVNALTVSGSNVYAGGLFTSAGGNPASYVARWNGSTWSPLGSGVGGLVRALAMSGSTLYVVGAFSTAGGDLANNVAEWNGNTWSAVGSGIDGNDVYDLAVSGNDVYAGGLFRSAGGGSAESIAKWDGTRWSSLGSGMGWSTSNPKVNALVVSRNELYAGGSFITAGNNPAGYIAKWSGSNWAPLGSPVDGFVNAFGSLNDDLYVGGSFVTAGGITANRVAKWDGSTWSTLGTGILGAGVGGPVNAVVVSSNGVVVGGNFLGAGGHPASYIAKWDGSAWSTMGGGVGSIVNALAMSGSNVYAGGNFSTAGGSPANYIAKWDGSNWSPLGSGMNGFVLALVVSGTNLYAAGAFTMAGGVAATNIARWDGSGWSAVGLGLPDFGSAGCRALLVSGTNLFAAGEFQAAGGTAFNIAKWDGASWSALGSGANNMANALASSGGDLYVGGVFQAVGGKVSAYVARALLYGPPLIFSSSSVSISNQTFHVLLSGPESNSIVIDSSTTLANWTPVATNILPAGGWQFSDPIGTNVFRFFRARFGP